MTLKTKIAAVALATLAVTGSIASTTTSAEARGFHRGLGIGAGLIGAAVVGGAIAAASGPYAYYPRCGWSPRYDMFGNYVGSVRTCY